jgi:DeoR family fructose operon transcriptional repressor
MNQELRKKIILDLLQNTDTVSIKEIARACQSSEITARRDLNELEEQGLLIRKHGGAIRSEAAFNLFSFDNRLNRNKERKIRVCQSASHYIRNNDIIFIDCGTTLYHLSSFIRHIKNLKIITNSLPIVSELMNYPNINIIIIGGEVVSDRRAIYGPAAERCIAAYHADRAFIGADGISLKNGLSSYDDLESAITRRMIENADEVYLLCDSSKLEKDSLIKFAPVSAIDFLVTDDELDAGIRKKYIKHKLSIITT